MTSTSTSVTKATRRRICKKIAILISYGFFVVAYMTMVAVVGGLVSRPRITSHAFALTGPTHLIPRSIARSRYQIDNTRCPGLISHGESYVDNQLRHRRGRISTSTTLHVDRSGLSSNSSSAGNSEHTNDDKINNLNKDDNSNAYRNHTYYVSPNRPWMEQQQPDRESSSATNSVGSDAYSFFDEAVIVVRAGSGGQGASTYQSRGRTGQQGSPDGGNGGRGGNVIVMVDPTLNTLAGLVSTSTTMMMTTTPTTTNSSTMTRTWIPKSFRAENGQDGERQFRNGRFGRDITIRVPPGTIVQEQIGADEYHDVGTILSDLDEPLIVARGGQGGEGSGVQGKNRSIKRPRLPPSGGERKTIRLTLKLVADVALVGVPNAGKSTFLAAVTRAKPKIANYPFTTVIPNLGVWIPSSTTDDPTTSNREDSNSLAFDSRDGSGSNGLVLCDVPGLIAGASQGVGLGHAFLRHVERCHVILHLVDATSIDPIQDYRMLNMEMVKYGQGQLAHKPQVVVVNKADVLDRGLTNDWEKGLQIRWSRNELETQLQKVMPHARLLWMSAKERHGVDEVMTRLAAFVKKVKESAE